MARPDSLDTHPATLEFAKRLKTPIWIFDIELERMLWANPAALELWQANDLDELLERDFGEDMSEGVRERLHGYLDAFSLGDTREETWTFHPRGRATRIFCHCRGFPLTDGRLAMLVEGHRAPPTDSQAIQAVEALRHTALGVAVYNAGWQAVARNPAASRSLPDHGAFADAFRDRAVFEALARQIEESGAATAEGEIDTRTGPRWFRLEARRMPDAETGEPMTVVSALDVTRRRASEQQLRTERERLRRLMENLPGGVLAEDEASRVVLVNDNFRRLFEHQQAPGDASFCSRGELRPHPHHFTDPDAFIRRTMQVLHAREPVTAEPWSLADGRIMERDYIPVFDGDTYRGHLWQFWDITERQANHDALHALATTDPLTGLANRRQILRHLEAEARRLDRHETALSVLLIDLDHFKPINDRHGHAAGDAALTHFAGLLQANLREIDAAGRIGGDEFLVLLPETDLPGARRTAERLRNAVLDDALAIDGGSIPLSISIGITRVRGAGEDDRHILGRADDALYAAKVGGRDAIRTA